MKSLYGSQQAGAVLHLIDPSVPGAPGALAASFKNRLSTGKARLDNLLNSRLALPPCISMNLLATWNMGG